MTDFMIDIETLGTAPGSIILSVGVTGFDVEESKVFGQSFYAEIDPASCIAHGLKADLNTVDWWEKQNKAELDRLRSATSTLPDVMLELNRYLIEMEPNIRKRIIWGHGATFDPVLLGSAFSACNMDTPWQYSKVRDTRTIFDIVERRGYQPIKLNNNHNALDDAINQAEIIMPILRDLWSAE